MSAIIDYIMSTSTQTRLIAAVGVLFILGLLFFPSLTWIAAGGALLGGGYYWWRNRGVSAS